MHYTSNVRNQKELLCNTPTKLYIKKALSPIVLTTYPLTVAYLQSQDNMSVEVQAPAHDVQTTLNYYTPIGEEPPFQYVQSPPEGVPKHNLGNEPHPAVVHDVRGHEDKYDIGLDKSGFQFVKHESSEKDFLDEERIEKVYYKEVEELLKKELGVKRVVIFDHTIR